MAWVLTLLYFGSYLMRINFAVMLVSICGDMGVAKTDLAIVITGLTISYGAGQIISGFLGDRIKPQNMISAGLAIAAICNVAMVFSHTIPLMTAVWTVNGFAHSMMWPPIIRIMSTYLADEEYSYANVRVSWGSSFATIFLYLGCPILLPYFNWRPILIICALGGIAILLTWMILFPKLFCEPIVRENNAPVKEDGKKKSYPSLPRFVFLPIALIMFGIICQGVLRDGVTNWMPSYLLETFGLSEEQSIISTVILAVFSIISYAVFSFVNDKIFKDEVRSATAIFVMSTAASAVLYVANTVFSASVPVSMLLMAMIVAFMHGINIMLIAHVPKRFVKFGKVATFSGILNSCTYIGASISTYAFAAIAETKGWNTTIFTWIIVCAVGTAVCIAALPLWKKFRKYIDRM